MEIDFVKKKDKGSQTSVASIKGKIKQLIIPAVLLDSGAEVSIMSEDIAKRLKLKVDTNEKYDLSGTATKTTESIGMSPELPITLAPGCIVYEKFVVIKYNKPLLAFSNVFLKRYDCAIDWATDELKIYPNRKEFVIPVTMHRVKNNIEVNHVVSSQQNTDQSVSKDEELKKNCVNVVHKTKREEELERALNKNIESLYVITECYNNLLTRVENAVAG